MIRFLLDKLSGKLRRDGIRATAIAILRFRSGTRTALDYKDARRRSDYEKIARLDSNKDRFSTIYKKKFWDSKESRSGEGSEVAYTKNLRVWLPTILDKYDIGIIVDAPCGDFNWMKLVLPNVDVKYHGFDIVDAVIKRNRELYSDRNIDFSVADICSDKLPTCDILIVRDCLFHLSYRDIGRFLKNVEHLNYRYLLTTTHIVEESFVNTDIVTGGFRRIDLFDKPFQFDKNSVIDRVEDFPVGSSTIREMVLIKKEDVPTLVSGV